MKIGLLDGIYEFQQKEIALPMFVMLLPTKGNCITYVCNVTILMKPIFRRSVHM